MDHEKNIQEIAKKYQTFRMVIYEVGRYMEENFLAYDYRLIQTEPYKGHIVFAYNDGMADSIEMTVVEFKGVDFRP